ncbi:MAG: MFS transporter [Bacteroidales bacterium]|nr:MFS transporter [Bacteroidales bacterium]
MSNIKKFLPLYTTSVFGVINDNALKFLAAFVAMKWYSEDYGPTIVNITAAALVLPYLFLSPLAGKLPKYFTKIRIIRTAKLAEFGIMAVALLGIYLQNIYITVASVLLMGLQSALFSPSKYGLIKDIGGIKGISEGMGGMEAFSFIGMLLGAVIGSFISEYNNLLIYFGVLVGFAALGYLSSLTLKADEQKEVEDSTANPIKFIASATKITRKYKMLPRVIHLLCLFWWLSASLQTLLMTYCKEHFSMNNFQTGCVLAIMAVGVALGCVICGKLDKKHFMIGRVYMFGIAAAILLFIIYKCDISQTTFVVLVTAVAFLGGMFKIPLDSEIQKRVETKELNIILAYFNLLSFVYIFMAAATNILIINYFGSKYVFLVLAIVFGLASFVFTFVYKSVITNFTLRKMKCHYRIKFEGDECLNVKKDENILLLPTHRAVIDPLLLLGTLGHINIRPLVDERFFKIPFIKGVLKQFQAVPVPDLRKSRKGVEQAMQLDSIIYSQLIEGGNILFYPSGHVTTDGKETIGARRLAYDICRKLPENTRVIGLRIYGLWGSQWSRYKKSATPNIVKLLLKSFVLIYTGVILFMKKRDVKFEFFDITDKTKEWSQMPKMDFNHKMEEFYNVYPDGEPPMVL